MKKIVLMFAILLLTLTIAHAQWVVEEGFEGTFPPTGWTLESASDDNWVQDDGTDYGPGSTYAGTYAAMYNNYDYSSGNSGSMITPAFDLSSTASPQLDFYWWNDDGSYNPAKLVLYSSIDGAVFTPFDTLEVYGSGGWVNYNTPLTADITHIKFEGISDYGSKNTFIDNFKVGQPFPYDVAVNQITPDATIIEGASYNYYMKISNIGLNTDVYDLALSGGTWTYEIRDKDDIGTISTIGIAAGITDTVIVKVTAPLAKDISDMVTFTATSQGDPAVFASVDITTNAYTPYLSLFENFDSVTAPDLPEKWSAIVQTTSSYPYVETYDSGTYAYSDTISVKMYNSSDTSAELLLVTPAVQTGVWGNVISAMVRTSSGTQDILVGTITDPTDPSTFSLVQSFEVTSTYTEIECAIDFAKATGYVAFKHACEGTYDYYYIDDVAWEEIVPEPEMVIDETTHDFGMVDQGTVDTWDVTIYNDGYGTLYFTGATVNAPFSVTYPDSIESLSNDVATITLDATTIGMFIDVLEFHTNATQDSTIDLSVLVKGADYVTEGFEETAFPPYGWENPNDYWARFETDAYEGQGYARCSWYHDYDAILITPRLDINGGDFIDFFWRNDNLYEAKGTEVIAGDTLWVEISNTYLNPSPTWEVIGMFTSDAPMDEYEEAFVSIPDTYIGNNAKVRFRHRSELNSESRGVGLDNIIMPAEYLPVNFAVDPYYASDYEPAGSDIEYTFDVTNEGLQTDKYIFIVQDSSAIRYDKRDIEDFETDDGGWVATASWDDVGDWAWTDSYDVNNYSGSHTPPSAAHSGTGLWATVPEGDYTNADGYSYLTKTVDFSDISDAYMTFWYWSDVYGSWDYCDIIVNSDILLTIDTYNPTAWVYADLDLSAYDGLSDVQIVFSFYATSVVNYAGLYIDDLDLPEQGGGGTTTGWPVTVSPPYLELVPGETGSFDVTVSIPEDATLDKGQLTPVLAYSREDNTVQHQVLVSALCHPKDPYEPNDLMVEATPADYDFVSEGAQIYYNTDYKDMDIDIYTIDCLEGEIVWCAFELAEDETEFDGAIKLVNADSTELAYADDYAGGGSEYLQYRIQEDGTYYWILGKWDNILIGKDSKKTVTKGENTTYYTVTFDLIPSPEVAVEPESITIGLIAGTGGTVSDEVYISNVATDSLAEDLSFTNEVEFPDIEYFLEEEFEDGTLPSGWSQEYVYGSVDWICDDGGHSGNPSGAYSGDYNALFYYGSYDGYATMLVTPELDLSTRTNYILDFWHAQADWSGDQDTLNVYYKDSPSGTWTLLESYTEDTPTWTERVISLPNPSSTYYIAFEGISSYGYGVCIDNVIVSNGVPWCTVTPLTGTVSQGNTRTVTVTCGGDDLDPGRYEAVLIVHNDALLNGASDIEIPIVFYISDEAGGLQGTVTFNDSPVDSVKVKVGNNITYTDEDGFYCLDEIPSGFFNVFFYKDGFQTFVADSVYLNPGWVVLLDVELTFDGPVPENLSATGIEGAVELDWDKPQTGGGGGSTQVEYVLDDGSYEDGWTINPGYEAWLGNLFPTDDGGEIVSFELYGDANSDAGTETVTIDVYDEDHNLIGSTGSFMIPADDWVTVPASNISFSGDFYAMVHWNYNSGETNFVGFDEDGPNASAGYDWYYNGSTWQLLHVAASSDAGVFGIRATAMVRGSDIELAYKTYQLGKEPEVTFHAVDVSAFEKGQKALDKAFARSGHSVDTGNREVSHYTFNGDKSLGFRMPEDITLLGYNVYELNKGFVAYMEGENNTSFTDDIVAIGTEYTYWVTAVYGEGESSPSNTATAIPLSGSIYHEPFDEDWSTTGWVQDPTDGNWLWSSGFAYLYWSPEITDYDMSLISPEITLPDDPADIYNITFSMYISDYSTDTNEIMEIWVIHDTGEDTLWTWDLDVHDDWGSSGGEDLVLDGLDAYAGQDIQLKFRSHGEDTYNFNYWYIYDILIEGAAPPPDYGALEGIVTDGVGNVVDSVRVTAENADYNPVYTDDVGYYLIDPMAVGTYSVEYYKEGYTVVVYDSVVIDSGVTTVLDVALGNPTMEIEPTSISTTVPVGGTSTTTITVTNNGNAPLNWGASIEDQTDLKDVMLENSYYGPTSPSEVAESNTNNTHTCNPSGTEETWDILFNYDLDTITSGTGIAGAEFGNGYFLAAEWGYNSGTYRTVYKLDVEGNLISSWVPSWAPSTAGLRDMAFDGEYFYAGTASTTIYQFDEDGNLYGTITSPVDVRAIAYDSDNDAFWVNNWDDDLKLIDRSGNVLNTISSPPSMYGCAYDNVSDGGPYLWIFTGTSSSTNVCQIEQYDLNTLSLTSVTHSVSDDFGSGIAGGLFTSGDIVQGTWVLGGLEQSTPDLLFGYELGPYASWISMNPTSGTVAGYGGYEEVTLTFDACDDPAGTIHTCNIVFESDQGLDPVTVPVTLMVGNPEYGTLAGTVTAATGGATIDSAMITASDDADNTYVTYTNSSGEYTIEDMMIGYYTVECTADGYNYTVEDSVQITADQTTTLNFALTAPIMVVNPTALSVNVPPGSTSTSYITVQNTGDGPMDYEVTLYDSSKTLTDYSNCSENATLCANKEVASTGGNSEGFQIDKTRDEVTLHYDGENNTNGIGLTDGGTFMTAARFTSDELSSYYDLYEIISVKIYIYQAVTSVILKVWEGGSSGDPGSEVYSQDVTSQITIDSWNTLNLTTAISLVSGNEYWVGYEVTHASGYVPAGIDAGPAVDEKGDWIYFNSSWDELQNYSGSSGPLDYNWNIRMVIDYGTPPWITVEPTSGTIAASSEIQIAVTFDATGLTQGEVKTAEIEIVSDPDVGTVTVPVTLTASDTIANGDVPVTETKLYANYPNPMLRTTTFAFSLKERSHVKLSVYNIKGQLVGTLLDTELDPAPDHKVEWDGTVNGKTLANGIYFYKLETNSKNFLKKMILMK